MSRGSVFDVNVTSRIGTLLERTLPKLEGGVQWTSVGYNFILSLQCSEVAVKHIEKKIFREGMASNLGHDIIGASGTLWINIDGSRLLLRIDPVRGSVTSSRLTVNANFDSPLTESKQSPGVDGAILQLNNNCVELDRIIKALSLDE